MGGIRLTAWLLVVSVVAALSGPARATPVADLNEAGRNAYARGDYEEAERLFARAIEHQPRQALLHYHHAVALTKLGRWRDAFRAYEMVLGLNPPVDVAVATRAALRELAPLFRTRPVAVPEVLSVPLERRGGVWFVEVVLNETRTTRFMIDTGASLCAISPELAESLGVRPETNARVVELQTANGRTSGLLVSIASIRVGEAEATNVPVVVVPAANLGRGGILGMSFLSRYIVTIDSGRRILTLGQR